MEFRPEQFDDNVAPAMQQPVPEMNIEAQEVLQYMTNVPDTAMNFEPDDKTKIQAELVAGKTFL